MQDPVMRTETVISRCAPCTLQIHPTLQHGSAACVTTYLAVANWQQCRTLLQMDCCHKSQNGFTSQVRWW